MRELIDGNHAAGGCGHGTEQPHARADDDSRSHRPTVPELRLSTGKDNHKQGQAGNEPGRNADPLRSFDTMTTAFRLPSLVVAQLLLVEDDASIRHALVRALSERGHAVASTSTAMDALQQIVTAPPDLVILDLGLPGLDGYEALRMLRAVSAVPVVVATARDDEADIVRALNAGADDYLVKPFGPGQIDARIRAVLRRAGEVDARRIAPGPIVGLWLDGEAYEAMLDGRPLDLSKREFDLLLYLARHAGQVVPKRDLLTHVWRMPYGGAHQTIDVPRSSLRRAEGAAAHPPRYLYT